MGGSGSGSFRHRVWLLAVEELGDGDLQDHMSVPGIRVRPGLGRGRCDIIPERSIGISLGF